MAICKLIDNVTTNTPPPHHHHTTTTTPHHHTTMICCNKYNFCSSISRHKDEVLKEDDTKTNDWQLEMNDKYLLDLRSNSSEELQRNEFKNMRPEIRIISVVLFPDTNMRYSRKMILRRMTGC